MKVTSCCHALELWIFFFVTSATRLKIGTVDVFIWNRGQRDGRRGVGSQICLMCVFVMRAGGWTREREKEREANFFLDTLKRKTLPSWPGARQSTWQTHPLHVSKWHQQLRIRAVYLNFCKQEALCRWIEWCLFGIQRWWFQECRWPLLMPVLVTPKASEAR